MSTLAGLYTHGAAVDWQQVTTGITPATGTLPTYPFQRQRYWSPSATAARRSARAVTNSQAHPLLGRRLSSPALTGTVFETVLDTVAYPLLAQHRIYGQIVVPGAHHLVMLATAAAQHHPTPTLTDVLFPQPLLLTDEQQRVLQVVLDAPETEAATFQLASRAPDEPEWTTHATGAVRAAPADTGDPHETPGQIQQRCAEDAEYVNWFYESGTRHGLVLDVGFRWQQRIWRRDGEALCQMRAPQVGDEHEHYPIHPGLIDASFQVVGAALPPTGDTFHLYVPFGLDEFRLRQTVRRHHDSDRPIWGHARLRKGADPDEETFTADVWLLDDDGRVVAESQGLHLKRAERDAMLRAARTQARSRLHELVWQPQPFSPPKAVTTTGRWLICADRLGVGEALAAQVRAGGGQAVVVLPGQATAPPDPDRTRYVDPSRPEDFADLIGELRADPAGPLLGAVFLWSLDADGPEPTLAELESAQELALGGLLHLVRALAAAQGESSPRVNVVTRGAYATADAPMAVAQTSLWGMANVIELEHPELWGGQIDIDPHLDPKRAATALRRELPADGERVVLRRNQRLVARLLPRQATRVGDASPVTVDTDGTYLVTGGLGALGLEVARWLVTRGARNLVLVGRRAPTAEVAARLDALRGQGAQIETAQADVASAGDVARLIQAVPATRPLRGVVHAAGVLDDGVLMRQPWESFARVLGPKVCGGWNLHQQTRHLPLDFFVLFSSAASLLGSAGQAAYAAGNAFLDGLAHHRRSRGLPAVSINWGPWTEAGMAASAAPRDGRWEAQGIGGITPDEGIEALEQILCDQPTQVGVLPVTWSRYLRRFPLGEEPALLRELGQTMRAGEPGGAGTIPRVRLREQLDATPPQARMDVVRGYVRDQVVKVLGLDPTSHVDPARSFFEFGLDSLMAVQLKNTLQSQLGRPLPSTLIFEYPTIEGLTTYLAQKVLGIGPAEQEEPEPSPGGQRGAPERLRDLSEEDLTDLLTKKLASLAERRRK
jgi:acyl transferase domain-containing protein/acyl carrier protein